MTINSGNKQTEIGLIPEDWQTANLGSLVEASAPIRYGIVQIGPDTYNGVPIVPIKHLKEISRGSLHRASTSIERRYAGSRIRHNDILLSVKGTIGQVGLVPEGFSGNIAREIARVRIKVGIIPQFVAYYLEGSHTQERIQRAVVGTTREEFSIAAVRNFAIALPPAPEQRAIAEALSDVDALLDALDRLIAKKRDLKQAAMQQLLTGQTRLAGFSGKLEITTFSKVVRHHAGNSALIKGKLLSSGASSLYPAFSASGQDVWCEHFEHEGEAVVVSAVGSRCGKAFKAAGKWSAIANTHVVWPDRTKIDIRYLEFFINDENFWLKSGTGQPFVLFKQTFSRPLLLPSITEQSAIADIVSDMDAELGVIRARRAKTAAVKQGMMQELLTGRTRLV